MGRKIWIIPKDTQIDDVVINDALANNCTEIATGIPPILHDELRLSKLPLAYEEPEASVLIKPRDLAAEIDDLRQG